MNKIKLSMLSIVGLLMLVIVSACGSSGVDSEDKEEVTGDEGGEAEFVIKAAQQMSKDDVTALGTEKFAELVDEKSDGRMEIDWHYGSQLGSDVETFEAMKNGNLDMAAGSVANLTTITNAFDPFLLPFLFESEQQTLNAVGSEEVLNLINEEINEHNLTWISSYDYGGPRVYGSSSKISTIDDLEGEKIRGSRSVMELAAYEAWGAKGITVDWQDTPEALRSGMVDGIGDTYSSINDGNLYQGGVVNNVVDIPFQWYFMMIGMNEEVWNDLPDDMQQVIVESARESEQHYAEVKAEFVNENIAEMVEEGLEINTVTDEDLEELTEITKEEVWPEFIGDTFTQEKLDLIIEEMGPVGDNLGDWGYTVEETE